MLLRRLSPHVTPAKLAPGDRVDVGGHPVRLAVNGRARRVSLRLDVVRREMVATAPSVRQLADAVRFAGQRAQWIAEHLDRLPQPCPLRPGPEIEVLGRPCRLEASAMRIGGRLIAETPHEPARLLAYGADEAAFGRAAVRTLKAEALRVLGERTAVHARRLALPCPPVAITDTRGRWGSCRQAGAGRPAGIRYSWRLVLAPLPVLDYVAAHEVAHLVEANHGPGFWAVVRGLYGDTGPARAWLKQHGARLQAVGR